VAALNNMFSNSGFWAVILGGSSGIGLATAQRLSEAGMNICIVHRDGRVRMKQIEKEFEIIRDNGVKFLSFNLDAGSKDTINEVVSRLNAALIDNEKVRLLLHSVAKGNLKPMHAAEGIPTLELQDFQLTIDAMALNWYQWTKALINNNLFASDARLLALTSEGNQKAWRGYAAVSAAKATLEALSRSMALEFASLGLRSNVVQAGVTDTPSLRMIPDSDKIIEIAAKRNPFKRLTTPQNVANAIALLCTDEASWINGALIPVDGGERIV
jgi:enoyl-[acyl-carrier protein] reductase III